MGILAYSGIGGQAVIEGIMMKNKDDYATAVRKPDGEIEIQKDRYVSLTKKVKFFSLPFVRGVFNFADSMILGMKTLTFVRNLVFVRGVVNFIEAMVLGMSCLTFSASFFEDEGNEGEEKGRDKKKESLEMGVTICLSIVLAVAIFVVLPFYISLLFQKFIKSGTLVILIEGMVRIMVFVGYIALISCMEDIKRVFMYHGAEHKCINCIEHGMDLTVENVKNSSKEHKRCGTSFLFFVVVITIIATMFIRVDSSLLRLVCRVAIVPLVAGVSYEFIRLAGRSENWLVNALSKPGLWMQGLTTREPDEDMIEVGIASVEAVFDWRAYVESIRGKGES